MKKNEKCPCEYCKFGAYMIVEETWWCSKYLDYSYGVKRNSEFPCKIFQNKEKFYEYIKENFSIDCDGMRIIRNIIDWVWLKSFDEKNTVNILSALLDGIGITTSEIEQFVN